MKLLFLAFALFVSVESSKTAGQNQACNPGELIPVPSDCSSFRYCGMNGSPMKCGPGTLFDPQLRICNHERSVICDKSNNNPNLEPGTSDNGNSDDNDILPTEDTPTTVNTLPEEGGGSEHTSNGNPGETNSNQTKSVCYFTNWAVYRGNQRYLSGDIDPRLCTHIVYAFAVLTNDGKIKVADPWADMEDYGYKLYEKVTALGNNKTIPVLIALGGWNDSAFKKYEVMLAGARQKFIKSVLEFIEKYGFSGLDLDYEYPSCPQNKCKPDRKGRENFTKLLRELREAFTHWSEKKGRNLQLTAAVSANQLKIENMYDIPALNKYLDFINLMAYDLSGQWDNITLHHSSLYKCSEKDTFSADTSVKAWIKGGMEPKKIVLGIPLYGRAAHLKNKPRDDTYGEPSYGKPGAGPFTKESGFWSFYEICDKFQAEKLEMQQRKSCGPYAYDTDSLDWVSYDDPNSVREKAKYIRQTGLGGAMVWSLDLDEFRENRCCNVRYPLLGSLNAELRNISGYENVRCGEMKFVLPSRA